MVWLSENWGSLLVGLILLTVVIAISIHLIRQKRSGTGGCGCGCEGCANRAYCHPPRKS